MHSAEKINEFILFCARFLLTLHLIAGKGGDYALRQGFGESRW